MAESARGFAQVKLNSDLSWIAVKINYKETASQNVNSFDRAPAGKRWKRNDFDN
jgi:hypothetical protein